MKRLQSLILAFLLAVVAGAGSLGVAEPAHAQLAAIGAGKGVVAAGGGSPTPAWVQMTASVQGGFGNPSTNNFGATTTNGNLVGIACSAATGNTPTSVVGNLSGGGTVALTQRATATLNFSGDDVWLYTVDNAAPITGIAFSMATATNPVCILFEASNATFDAANLTSTTASASEHTATVTTTAADDLIGVYGYTFGTISTIHSGYSQVGSTFFGYFSVQNSSATGASGSKTTGFTPTGSTSSNQFVFALKGL